VMSDQERYAAALRELIQPTRAADYAAANEQTLAPMRALMRALGDPQDQFESIVVAGSVGKTSLCHQIAAGVRRDGQRVGLYTSPHLHSFRERFIVDGTMISMAEFVETWSNVKRAISALATQHSILSFSTFEAATVLCLLWFARKQVDIAVLEVGLGGRFDAVNIVSNVFSVITPIELEHAALLGGTLERIAWHKAGVFRRKTNAYSVPQQPEVMAVLQREAEANKVTLFPIERLIDGYPTILPLTGRAERTPDGILIDGAHTVGGVRRLCASIAPSAQIVVGMLRDKAVADVLAVFDQPGLHLLLTTAPGSRGLPAAELAARYTPTRATYEIVPNLDAAFQQVAAASADGRIVTGSLRMAAAAREYFGLVTGDMIAEAAATRAIYAAKNATL